MEVEFQNKSQNLIIVNEENTRFKCYECGTVLDQQEAKHHLGDCKAERSGSPESRLGAYTVMSFDSEEERHPCSYCKRKFWPSRLEKHEKACEFASKKRPIYDIKRKRLPLLDQSYSRSVSTSKRAGLNPKYKDKKWHKHHEDFLNKLRFARKIEESKERGLDTSNLKVPDLLEEDYQQCPHCFRKFGPTQAEKHISNCKNVINKPRPPPSVISDSSSMFPQIQKNSFGNPNTKRSSTNRNTNSLNVSEIEVNSSTASLLKPECHPKKSIGLPRVSPTDSYKKLPRETPIQRSMNTAKVECPHCKRTFNNRAAERHTPICKKINQKPRRTEMSPKVSSKKRLRRLNTDCKQCKAPLPLEAKFCMMCGTKK